MYRTPTTSCPPPDWLATRLARQQTCSPAQRPIFPRTQAYERQPGFGCIRCPGMHAAPEAELRYYEAVPAAAHACSAAHLWGRQGGGEPQAGQSGQQAQHVSLAAGCRWCDRNGAIGMAASASGRALTGRAGRVDGRAPLGVGHRPRRAQPASAMKRRGSEAGWRAWRRALADSVWRVPSCAMTPDIHGMPEISSR